MISLLQIQRLVEEKSYGRLIDRILTNGRSVEPAVAKKLHHTEMLVPAAYGLALQRCCELSYGPTEIAHEVAMRLLIRQRDDGSFGGSPAATAIAARGLLESTHQQREVGAAVDDRAVIGVTRSLASLARAQSADGLFGTDVVVADIVLWQLADCEAFRSAVRFDALVNTVNRSFLPILHSGSPWSTSEAA